MGRIATLNRFEYEYDEFRFVSARCTNRKVIVGLHFDDETRPLQRLSMLDAYLGATE